MSGNGPSNAYHLQPEANPSPAERESASCNRYGADSMAMNLRLRFSATERRDVAWGIDRSDRMASRAQLRLWVRDIINTALQSP